MYLHFFTEQLQTLWLLLFQGHLTQNEQTQMQRNTGRKHSHNTGECLLTQDRQVPLDLHG